jgi:hypothetical protein
MKSKCKSSTSSYSCKGKSLACTHETDYDEGPLVGHSSRTKPKHEFLATSRRTINSEKSETESASSLIGGQEHSERELQKLSSLKFSVSSRRKEHDWL